MRSGRGTSPQVASRSHLSLLRPTSGAAAGAPAGAGGRSPPRLAAAPGRPGFGPSGTPSASHTQRPKKPRTWPLHPRPCPGHLPREDCKAAQRGCSLRPARVGACLRPYSRPRPARPVSRRQCGAALPFPAAPSQGPGAGTPTPRPGPSPQSRSLPF